MPSFTMPRHWLAQTFALLCMALVYAAIFGLTCYIWKIGRGGTATLGQAFLFSALLWVPITGMAAALFDWPGMSFRAMMQQQALAGLFGFLLAGCYGLVVSVLIAGLFDSGAVFRPLWGLFTLLFSLVMVPGMMSIFAIRLSVVNAT
ncbi:MAG TPA: hypothetical protein VHP58_01965 [Alphaproteobacteria bacterium]|nr:hypothetical protein [Alphaproteobacteria bacterium]